MARSTGSKNVKTFAHCYPTRCKECGSTDRTDYANTRTRKAIGTNPRGEPITHIVRSNTSCNNCDTPRIDISYYNRPTKKPAIESRVAVAQAL